MEKYGEIGLWNADIYFNEADPASYSAKNVSGYGLDRSVESNTVTYSYFLKEYRGRDEWPSRDKVIHSSASCIGRLQLGLDLYEHGQKIQSFGKRYRFIPASWLKVHWLIKPLNR
jgi:hypothetical protein